MARPLSAFPGVLTNGSGGAAYVVGFLKVNGAVSDPDAFRTFRVEYEANGPGMATCRVTIALDVHRGDE